MQRETRAELGVWMFFAAKKAVETHRLPLGLDAIAKRELLRVDRPGNPVLPIPRDNCGRSFA